MLPEPQLSRLRRQPREPPEHNAKHRLVRWLSARKNGSSGHASSAIRQVLVAFLSRREVTSALTSLAAGFLALLLLSRNELPTGEIHDTLALGIGLGFLSDDQLLNRIKGLRGT